MKDDKGNIIKKYANMERVKEEKLSEYYVRSCCDRKNHIHGINGSVELNGNYIREFAGIK